MGLPQEEMLSKMCCPWRAPLLRAVPVQVIGGKKMAHLQARTEAEMAVLGQWMKTTGVWRALRGLWADMPSMTRGVEVHLGAR